VHNLSKYLSLIYCKMKKMLKSFSLIEVLIFVSILSLFFVTAAMVIVAVLQNTTTNQNKIIATHYAEELRSWLQSEKETNWGGEIYIAPPIINFTQHVSQPLTDFCFNTSPVAGWPLSAGASNCGFSLDNGFRRIATFSAIFADPTTSPGGTYINQVGVNISVEWMDRGRLYSSPLKTVFSIWE